ncbi:hypothetical protein [Pseudodesulfovibrio senegalensis]|jgi:hypothetical protein|uniref:Uncharacterized protein n=1 Tax=Pseudodesulfovibrio senegalensis TaxID=1721087 RepID=A0A6N6N101_9BACT|nr:hypothetical protein [Pseudodesulfovibrio senegalensis]KAB1441547.1 hypothetical protein F8A88_11470 [Pseudodesulfovibrio senegalensis]
MQRTATIILAAAALCFFVNMPVVGVADEIRDDYSSYVRDVRSGKANEEKMPAGLLKKLEETGKEKKQRNADAPAPSPSGPAATKRSVDGDAASSPPGDMIIIHKSGKNDQ